MLAESETLGRAMPAILKAISESLGWHWSALWTIDREAGVLRCGDIWHAPAVQLADFSAMSQGMTFASGGDGAHVDTDANRPAIAHLGRGKFGSYCTSGIHADCPLAQTRPSRPTPGYSGASASSTMSGVIP